MKLSQLRYFVNVCELGGVTAAAEYLHISQPSLSIAIRDLEQEFGLELFFRRKQRMILSDEGKFFFKQAKELIVRVDELEMQMKNLAVSSQTIRIGVQPVAVAFLYPRVIMPFKEQNPGVNTDLVIINSHDEVEHLFNTNQMDVMITNYPPLSNSYLNIPIMETQIKGCVSKSHPLAGQTGVTVSDLKKETLIMFGQGSRTTALLQQAFLNENAVLNPFMHTSQLYMIVYFVKKHGMVSFLADELLNETPDVASFALDVPIWYTYSLIRRMDIPPSKDVIKFINYCKNLT